jgi:CheY-like chemotaxis protein
VKDILIVEDDEQVRRALAKALVSEGYTVATAGNGEEALDDLEHAGTPPKIIIMDLMMPVMDGWKFRQRLLARPQWAHVPVIVFSGSGCDEASDALPGVHYIPKPVSLRTLFDSVARLIAEPVANRPN